MMLTRSGRLVDPVDIDPTLVTTDDVAWALANTNRWGGHCSKSFSVAQHCLAIVSYLRHDTAAAAAQLGCDITPTLVLAALHHDDGEAFFGDMPRQLKHRPEMLWYREAEHACGARIANTLCGFDVAAHFRTTKPLDAMSLNAEADMFFPPTDDVLEWFDPNHEALNLPNLPARHIQASLAKPPEAAALEWVTTHRQWAEMVIGANPRRD
jgi:hypothetical protein